MKEIKNIIKQMTNFDKVFAILFSISLISIQLITDSTMISLLCSCLGIAYVILARLGHRFSMIFGAIQALLYCMISFKATIFGDFMLNLYNVIFMTYGYIQWNKNKKNNQLEIRDLDKKQSLKVIIIMIIIYTTLVLILKKANGYNYFLDAFTTTVSMTGLYLMAMRFRQCWIAWNINNIFSMILWTTLLLNGNANAPVMIAMFFCYTCNSILGYIDWYKKK